MPVTYTLASQSEPIPLSYLDTNFSDSLIAMGTKATTASAPSAVDFSFTTPVRRVVFLATNISTNGSNTPLIQIGQSGAPVTANYSGDVTLCGASSVVTASTSTSGAQISTSWNSSLTANISAVIEVLDASTNMWLIKGCMSRTDAVGISTFCVAVDFLGGPDMNILRFTTNSADQFDTGGSINVLYER